MSLPSHDQNRGFAHLAFTLVQTAGAADVGIAERPCGDSRPGWIRVGLTVRQSLQRSAIAYKCLLAAGCAGVSRQVRSVDDQKMALENGTRAIFV